MASVPDVLYLLLLFILNCSLDDDPGVTVMSKPCATNKATTYHPIRCSTDTKLQPPIPLAQLYPHSYSAFPWQVSSITMNHMHAVTSSAAILFSKWPSCNACMPLSSRVMSLPREATVWNVWSYSLNEQQVNSVLTDHHEHWVYKSPVMGQMLQSD